jgi:hypothetical protein
MTDGNKLLTLQGYDYGDHDTGIISNRGSIFSDEYLLTNENNHCALLLQSGDYLERLLNDPKVKVQ